MLKNSLYDQVKKQLADGYVWVDRKDADGIEDFRLEGDDPMLKLHHKAYWVATWSFDKDLSNDRETIDVLVERLKDTLTEKGTWPPDVSTDVLVERLLTRGVKC